MPILKIEIVTAPHEDVPAKLAEELANQAGEVFGSAPRTTWVKVQLIPGEHYAENGGASEGVYPVFVEVLKAKLPAPEVLQAEAAQLAEAIARACNRPPEHVHIFYLPEGAGRVAFGGQLLLG